MKFTKEALEHAVIELFAAEDIPHASGMYIHKSASEVFLKDDLSICYSTNTGSTINLLLSKLATIEN